MAEPRSLPRIAMILATCSLLFHRSSSAPAPASNLCIPRERDTLLDFKAGLTDPGNFLSSWQGADCCQWKGVECSNGTGHVIMLRVNTGFYSPWRIGGEIRPSLLTLQHLDWLDLSENDFGGKPIPEFIGGLGSLTSLVLSNSNFGGRIPPHIGNLSNLDNLHITNSDDLTVPEEEAQGETEEEAQGETEGRDCYVHVGMTADMLAHMQKMQQGQGGGVSSGSWGHSPRPSDMIPALQGLSSLQVSFGSVGDVSMPPVDTVLGKRGAEEPEVQGQRLELSLGLNYGHKQEGGKAKKGKTQVNKEVKRNVEVVYKRNKKLASTGRFPTGELTRPNVWSRQEQ